MRPSRFAGMGMPLVGGLGLLGLLVTVLIMALMMTKVIGGVSGETTADAPEAHSGGQVLDPGPRSGQPERPGVKGVDAAEAMECRIGRRALVTAAQAYLVMNGVPPADQQALIDEQLLDEPVPNQKLTATSGKVTVTGTGPCA